ncbi:MAG: cytidylyltransferase domain-containing protein [Lachnospiraceae bacterium]
MEKIVSFIPIKLNNQRLPGKNTMLLGKDPLCNYIFKTVSRVNGVDENYVYCSDERIKEYIPEKLRFFKRDAALDGPQVKGLEIIDRFIQDVDADIYILTHVTQPFTKTSSIQTALDKVVHEGYDSAFSCVCIQDYCWYQGKPFNYQMNDIVTTQDLEPVYMETGAFYIFRKEVFTELRQRIGKRPYMQIMDAMEAVDIDTQEDFDFARVVHAFQTQKEAMTNNEQH